MKEIAEEVAGEKEVSANHYRRDFLKKTFALTVSSTVVYVVGTAFKELDGSLVAGAKTCGYDQGLPIGGDCRTVSCESMFVPTGSSCGSSRPTNSSCCNGFSTPCSCW